MQSLEKYKTSLYNYQLLWKTGPITKIELIENIEIISL